MKAKDNDGNVLIAGAYISKSIPDQASESLSESVEEIPYNPEDFYFIYVQSVGICFMKPTSSISAEFVIDYELNGYISFGRRFMLFSMGYEHEMVCGELDELEQI